MRPIYKYLVPSFVFAAAILFSPAFVSASTQWVSSDITTNTTWTAGNVYVINNSPITVSSGATLTIDAGTVVKFSTYTSYLVVAGNLQANGTAGSPIYFTSYKDDNAGGDTNSDATSSSPGRGDWYEVRFDTGSSSTLDNVIARYGGTNYDPYANFNINGGDVDIENSTSTLSLHRDVYMASGTLTIASTTLADSIDYGIYVIGPSTVMLTNNTFYDNPTAAGFFNYDNGLDLTHSGNSASGTGYRGFLVGGTIGTDQTWTEDIPYIPSTLFVGASSTLTVGPGAVVKFKDAFSYLSVAGNLTASGTPSLPIYFTTLKDDDIGGDTNADATSTTPSSNSWGAIQITSGGNATLDRVVVRYGGSNSFSGIVSMSGNTLDMSNSTVDHSYTAGIYTSSGTTTIESTEIKSNSTGVTAAGGTESISGSDLSNNTYYGLYVVSGTVNAATTAFENNAYGIYKLGGTATITRSVFDGNSSYGAYGSFSTVSAEDNYWGDSSGPYPTGSGDAVNIYVDADPWSTAAWGLSLSDLTQYKSDATTTVASGSSTSESYVIFGADLDSIATDTLQLQVEVEPAGTSFTGTPNATSSFVSPSSSATAVFGTSSSVYPRDPESSSNGDFHWQARVAESSTGLTSDWQLYGASTSSTDFTINTVPLYLQKSGPWPSSWHGDTYYDGSVYCDGGNTIGYCGCAITTVSMWLRYYGITTDADGNDVNPGTLNTWLTTHGGYDTSTGNVIWTAVERYASSSSGYIVFDENSVDHDASSTAELRSSYVDPNLSSSTPNPVILKENANGHFALATGFAFNDATSTYTVRDSAWYDTKYLNQATSSQTSSTTYGYENNIDGVRLYYDPPILPLQAEYHVNLPNGIMLVDSQGRRTGKDPATGIVYREIPGAHYGEDCLSRTNCAGELITSNLRDGKYTLYVLGGSTGKFGLSVYNNRGLSQSFGGDIQPNTMRVYTQNYDSAKFATSSLSFEEAVSSTVSVGGEPPQNVPVVTRASGVSDGSVPTTSSDIRQ